MTAEKDGKYRRPIEAAKIPHTNMIEQDGIHLQ